MTYQEILAHIFSRGRFGMKPGLERITAILSGLGNPHQRLVCVQIAGTNGKGSTGAFLSAILTVAGYRTAFFSSPHLSDFSERFRINGEEIDRDILAEAARRVLAVAPPEATFFEIVTAIGVLCFAEAGVELAVMEAGMGGGRDATNVVNGLLSIITPVSLDHCAYLGHSLREIAAEKSGIIKPGKPVVIGPQEPEVLEVIQAQAAALGSPCCSWGADFGAEAGQSSLVYRDQQIVLDGLKPSLAGRFQVINGAVAIAASRLLGGAGFIVTEQAIRSGIGSARWPGRLELFPGTPPLLLDGAHNPAGVMALTESLNDFRYERLVVVIGVMEDKAWQEMILPLLEKADRVIAVAPALDRALPGAELAEFFRNRGVDAVAAESVGAGMDLALAAANDEDLILVCGSLFTVGEARALITGREFAPIRG